MNVRRSLRLAAALLVLAPAGCVPAPAPGPAAGPGGTAYVRSVRADEADLWRGQNYRGLVLDVRSPEEWTPALEPIAGATAIPLGELEGRLSEITGFRDQAVLAYAKDGPRGLAAAQLLARNGFREVSWLEGGLAAYRAAQAAP